MENKIGPQKKEPVWNRYRSRWVTIHTSPNGMRFIGKVSELIDGYCILNPSVTGEYNKEGKFIRKLSKKDISAYLIGASIEPTTKRSIENFCASMNEEELKNQITNPNCNKDSC